ncbi:hypothetical protein LSH36_562g00036 [Paralvinella palmiformis]|uniref:Protein-lysine N-methyltransferase SMYD4 n=1 Tax=Paralvinella palmiformis TaxID=53620 RepID=A0AAD9J6X6_9ANNE|nr:hypothetical protein LSH36_562g00036 [Paralvinella palmiformis]
MMSGQPSAQTNPGGSTVTDKDVVKQEAEFVSERMDMMISAILEDKQKERLSEFNQKQTDEDRFSYIWSLPPVHEVIQLEEEYSGKSSTEAAKFRQKGNKYFQNKSYLSALDAYSKSVIQAPVLKEGGQGDNELALSYGNRSATLYHLCRYRDCLDDIELAFQSGYPKDSCYKLFDRRGKCYLAMGKGNSARESFTKALECIQSLPMDERLLAKWNENLAKQLNDCNSCGKARVVDKSKPERSLPKLTHGPNENYPRLSRDVRVEYNKNKGRHLKADQDIHVGDVLAVEEPYSSVLYQEQHETHCYNCMSRVDRPVPCVQCSTVVFCSQGCRQRAWQQYHQYECRFFVLFDKLLCARIGHLAIRTVMVTGLTFILDYLRNKKNLKLSGQEETDPNKDQVYRGNYDNIYHLEANTKERFPINLFDYTVIAAFLNKILIKSDFFKQDGEDYATAENVTLIGGLLLHQLQIIQCNAIRILEAVPGCQFDQPGNMTIIGVALYPTESLVNHSCDPVGDFSMYGDKLVFRAIRNIYGGEEVTVSYGPLYYDSPIKIRQQQLRECYFFTCDCEACTEFWPTVSQLEDCVITFRCEACRNIIDVSKNPYKKITTCEDCHHQQNLEQVVGKLEMSHENIFTSAMGDAFAGRYGEAAGKYADHLVLMQKYLSQPWREFTSCQVCLKQCYRLLASQ